MGALRERFWERPLAELTRPEWEALCDGCGRCCLHKMEDEDTGRIEETNVACRLLDCASATCRDYPNRKSFVPDCLRLTLKIVDRVPWLPSTCAYRLRGRGEPLPQWHPLVSGRDASVHEAGISIRGRAVSYEYVHPDGYDEHVVNWVE